MHQTNVVFLHIWKNFISGVEHEQEDDNANSDYIDKAESIINSNLKFDEPSIPHDILAHQLAKTCHNIDKISEKKLISKPLRIP